MMTNTHTPELARLCARAADMKYTVNQLNAMPVGTVLMRPESSPNWLAVCQREIRRCGEASWVVINGGHGALKSFMLAPVDFTHRADPQSITPAAGGDPC